jgi:hypothetical protein
MPVTMSFKPDKRSVKKRRENIPLFYSSVATGPSGIGQFMKLPEKSLKSSIRKRNRALNIKQLTAIYHYEHELVTAMRARLQTFKQDSPDLFFTIYAEIFM